MATPLTFFYSKTPGVDYLYRSVPSGFNQTKWTFSTWFKLPTGFTYVAQTILSILSEADGGYANDEVTLSFAQSNLYFTLYRGGHYSYFVVPGGLQVGVLYCLQFDYDSSNATEDDRIRIYLDGTRLEGYEFLPNYWYPPAQNDDTYASFTDPTYVISGYLLGVDEGSGIGEYSPEKLLQGRTFLVAGSNPAAADVYAGTLPSTYGSAGFLLLYETALTIADDSSGNNNDFILAGSAADSWFQVPYKDLTAEWDLVADTVYRDILARWNVPDPSSGNVAFTDFSALTHIWGAVDTTSFNDVLTSFLESNQSAFDSFVFADVIANAYPLGASESVVLSSPAVQVLRATMPLVTTLRFTSPIAMQRNMAFAVATALVLRDVIGTVKHFGDLIANADFVDTVVDVIRAVESVIESLILESSATDYLTIFISSADSAAFTDEASQFSSVFDHVGDTINFVGALGIDSDEYTVWAVHTQYPGATEYDNYDFNSFAQVGNVYLGAKSDGIYELGGSDDAGTDIAAVIRTGLFDFGSAQLKQVTRAYLGYTSSNRLVLKTIATDGGQKVERWYELKDKTADEVRESRIKLGKGVKSRYWQFELINIDGGSFEIDQLHLMPLMLSRRVKE